MKQPKKKTLTIAVAAYEGINPFHLSIPYTVFNDVTHEDGTACFNIITCSLDKNELTTSMGFKMNTPFGIEDFHQADILIIPSWHDIKIAPPSKFINVLQQAHQRGAKIVGLCLGAFALAEANLLNGRTATTHWMWAESFKQRYPDTLLKATELYVDEGDILTSAGVAAGIDCCLHLLRQLCGAETANHIARQLVVAPHRQGGQAQFIETPLPTSSQDNRLSQVLDWAIHHLEFPHSIDDLAQRAAMSRRTFTRHIRRTTGTTIMQWLLNQRIAKAQRMLESGNLSIENIARDTGFGSIASLRQHFVKKLSISPSAYRKQFRIKSGQLID